MIRDDDYATASDAEILAAGGVYPEMFGAAGNGTTDDTAAFQSWINHYDAYTATHPDYRAVTVGGGVLRLANRKYLVKDTLYLKSSLAIIGGGISSQILFAPTSAKNLFEASPDYAALNGQHFITLSDFAIFGQNANAQDAIYFTRTRDVLLDRLFIAGFARYNVHFGWAAGAYAYSNKMVQCWLEDAPTKLRVDAGAHLLTCDTCYFYDHTSYVGALFDAEVHASAVVFNNCSFEGVCATAHIDNAGVVTVNGGYGESPTITSVPFMRKYNLTNAIRGSSVIEGFDWQNTAAPLVQYTDFDLTTGEAAATYRKDADRFLGGTPQPIRLFKDGSFHLGGATGSVLQPFTVTANHATMSRNTANVFNSRASLSIAHDGSGVAHSMNFSIASALAPYASKNVYISFLLKDASGTIGPSRVTVSNPTVEAKLIIDYGNGWKLYAMSFAVTAARLSSCVFTIQQLSGSAASAYITNLQGWLDGFPQLPVERRIETDWTTFTPTLSSLAGTFAATSVPWARYRVNGDNCEVSVALAGCSLATTASSTFGILVPGLTAASQVGAALSYVWPGLTTTCGAVTTSAGSSVLNLTNLADASVNWPVSASGGTIVFEIAYPIAA